METTNLTIVTAGWIFAVILLTVLFAGAYTLSRPSEPSLQRALARAGRGQANHQYTNGTRSTSGHPLGKYLKFWQIDFDRVQVGQGEHAFSKAKQLLASLEHIQLTWSCAHFNEVKEDAPVIAYTRILGAVYVLSPLRVAYAVESMGPHCIPASDAARDIRQLPCFAKGKRFDLALTSLEGSALSLEERCSVQWCQEDGSVWYELYSISKPATLDAYLGYPLLRYYKRKFRGASIAGVKKMLAPKDETADAAMRMWDTMKMG